MANNTQMQFLNVTKIQWSPIRHHPAKADYPEFWVRDMVLTYADGSTNFTPIYGPSYAGLANVRGTVAYPRNSCRCERCQEAEEHDRLGDTAEIAVVPGMAL